MMMKRFYAGFNSAVAQVAVMAVNAMGIGDAGDDGVVEFQISPAGDFENTISVRGVNTLIVQRVDDAAMDEMIRNFNSLTSKVAHLMRGVPIYEGHIDAPDQLAKNGSQAKAVGRIKKLYKRDGALWASAVMNAEGVPLITGAAAPYSANSPHWSMVDTGEAVNGVKIMRPVQVNSTALVNHPNLSGNFIGLNMEPGQEQEQENDMDLTKLKALLKLDDNASEDDVMAAITALLNKVTSTEGDSAALNAANTELTAVKKELGELKTAALKGKIETALNSAVSEGRITEAMKPAFETLLNTNFEQGEAALNAIPASESKPAEVKGLNSSSVLGGVTATAAANAAPGAAAEKVDMIPAFNKVMADNGFDKGNQSQVDQAWKMVRASK